MQKSRDGFIDIIKIYACVLVVLGHLFQSMTVSGIIQETALTQWFDQTIYFFHVPLFFICSGYLYQKYSKVLALDDWSANLVKKATSLLIPYFVFSAITWALKYLFSSAVNDQVDGFLKTLFLAPLAPYWYLYALFFIFLITPTYKNKKTALVFLAFALVIKVVSFVPLGSDIYALFTVMQNEIWFVIGMCVCAFDLTKIFKSRLWLITSLSLSVIFVVLSVFIYAYDINYKYIDFAMGIMACVATVGIAVNCESIKVVEKINSKFAQYTLPVFLMHTIFAAGLRAVLSKLGITNSLAHIILGLAVSFIGPVLAAIIMSKVKWLDFMLYPNKYLKTKPRGKNNG